MDETLKLVLAWFAGISLGAIFFGGLWWTVRRGVSSKQPAVWFFASLIVRVSVALPGFYFASGGDWERLLACLVGFTSASLLVARLTNLKEPGLGHAPYA